jgi:hypothetical protein
MARRYWLSGLLIVLATAATLGCNRNAVQQKPPPDPLLISTPGGVSVKVANKQQTEAKVQPAGREAVGPVYPPPPSLPDSSSVTPATRLVPLQEYRD